jgi:hypothetical protein
MADAAEATATQTPVEGGPVGGALGMDALIDQYLSDDADTPAPTTSGRTAATRKAQQDNPEDYDDGLGGPGEGGVDTDDDLLEGEDTGVEEDEEEDDGTLEDEDAELDALLEQDEEEARPAQDTPEESFLSKFDKAKFLKEHPELEAPYKSMQAAFTKAMQKTAVVRKEAEAHRERATSMEEQYNAFQQYLQNDETFEEFLVQVSLNRPEVMDRAYERAVSLNEDEGKKKEYLQEKELTETKRKLEEREKKDEQQRLQARVAEIQSFTKRVASKLGLTGHGDLEVAEQYVANQILQNAADNGRREISSEQIVAAVRRAAKALVREKEAARRTERGKVRREGLKAAQKRLKQPQRPAPPRSGAAPAARSAAPAPAGNRPQQNALDAWIDQQLEVEA